MKVNCKHEGQLQSFKREQFSMEYLHSVCRFGFTRYVDTGDYPSRACWSVRASRDTRLIRSIRRLSQSIYADFGRRISHNHSW
jgi:hypothetical protein